MAAYCVMCRLHTETGKPRYNEEGMNRLLAPPSRQGAEPGLHHVDCKFRNETLFQPCPQVEMVGGVNRLTDQPSYSRLGPLQNQENRSSGRARGHKQTPYKSFQPQGHNSSCDDVGVKVMATASIKVPT